MEFRSIPLWIGPTNRDPTLLFALGTSMANRVLRLSLPDPITCGSRGNRNRTPPIESRARPKLGGPWINMELVIVATSPNCAVDVPMKGETGFYRVVPVE